MQNTVIGTSVLFLEYEIQRQTEVLENGGEVTNETRSYDADYG